jgi:hypothetical protein
LTLWKREKCRTSATTGYISTISYSITIALSDTWKQLLVTMVRAVGGGGGGGGGGCGAGGGGGGGGGGGAAAAVMVRWW